MSVATINPYGAEVAPADVRAGAVLNALAQRLRAKGMWGLVRTLIVGLGSFGLAPLWIWPKRFGDVVETERVRYLHLAEWMRLNHPGPEGDELVRRAAGMRVRPLLWVVPMAATAALVFAFAATRFPGNWGDGVWDATYGYWAGSRLVAGPWTVTLWQMWVGALVLGYVCHWAQVAVQMANVRRFIVALDGVCRREGVAPVGRIDAGWAGAVWPLAGGLVLGMMGVLWAMPMLLAGWIQRRYAMKVADRTRWAVADRARAILRVSRPEMAAPMPILLVRRCPRDLCQAAAGASARYCPRCGARLGDGQ